MIDWAPVFGSAAFSPTWSLDADAECIIIGVTAYEGYRRSSDLDLESMVEALSCMFVPGTEAGRLE